MVVKEIRLKHILNSYDIPMKHKKLGYRMFNVII